MICIDLKPYQGEPFFKRFEVETDNVQEDITLSSFRELISTI